MATDSSDAAHPPKDSWNLAFSIYLLVGAGYLVPWNAFITAIDYFELLYPSGQIDRVFSIVYIVPAVICILLLTFLGRRIRASLRVNAGLLLFTCMLVLVPVVNILFISDAQGTTATYSFTIFAAMMNGVSDALVSGVVGAAGELPARYMEALMIGTAISGVLVSILRLITKAVMPQNNWGTVASAYFYFSVSTVIMVACIICYNLVDKLPIMKYYRKLRTTSEFTHLLESSRFKTDNASLLVEECSENYVEKTVSYRHLWKKIQGFALSIFFIYLVTLSIFPGHITEDHHSSYFGDWYGVLLTLCYNLFDLIGKFLPSVNSFMTESKIIAIGGSVGRVVFYPLFYLCLHGPSIFQADAVVMLVTCFLGLTNGYLTTVLMVLAPKSVPLEEAEIAGILMVLFQLLGLAAGSILEWIWVL